MAETPEQAHQEVPGGAPGTELGLAAGNVVAFGLTLLGGMWIWLALALAAGGAGVVAWRMQRRRSGRGSIQGRTSGSRGTSGSRSSGLPGFGRSTGGRRGGSGQGGGGTSGRGRRTGRGSGRGTGATSAPKRTGRSGLFGRGRTGAGRGGPDGGRPSRSGSNKGSGRRSPASLFGRGSRGRGTGRAGAGQGGTAPSRKARGAIRRPAPWKPSTKADVVNTTGPKKPATSATKPTAKKPDTGTTGSKKQPGQKAQPQKPAEPHPYRNNPTTGHTTKGNIMAAVFGKRWRQNAEEIHIQALRYDPEQMPDYLDDLGEMTRAFEEEAKALGRIAAVSESELPVDPRLVEYIMQTQATMRKVSEDAGEVVAHFKKLHEQELSRHEQRRRGEEKWNVK